MTLGEEIILLLLGAIVTVLLGAIVTVLLVPYVTNIWQTHQKGLEIRINLVGRISQTVMGMMIMTKREPKTEILEESDEYRKLKVDRSVIWAELESYFPNEEIGRESLNLFEEIESFYDQIKELTLILKSSGRIGKTDIKIREKQILHKKYVLMQLVLNRPMSRFSAGQRILRRIPGVRILGCWTKSKLDIRRLKLFQKHIASLRMDQGNLDQNDNEPLNQLKSNIFNAYSKGMLNEQQYHGLSNETSALYEKKFRQRIDNSLKSYINSSAKQTINKELDEIRNEVQDAFTQEMINEKSYDSLSKYFFYVHCYFFLPSF